MQVHIIALVCAEDTVYYYVNMTCTLHIEPPFISMYAYHNVID